MVTSAGKITEATRQQCQTGTSRRFLVRDGSSPRAWSSPPGRKQWLRRSSAGVGFVPPARQRTPGNNATSAAASNVDSEQLRFARFRRRRYARPPDTWMSARRYHRRHCRDSNVAQLFRRHWFAWLQDENCHRAYKRGDGPPAALGWAVSRMFAFLPRVANSPELGRLTRALVRFLRCRRCLLSAIDRFRRSENKGRAAPAAWSLSNIATTDLRAA